MRQSPMILALVLAAACSTTAQAQAPSTGIAGPYLAARAATFDGDHRAAAFYFESALAVDPQNPRLVGNAIFANAAMGQWARAAEIAEGLAPGSTAQELAQLVAMVRGVAAGDLIGARAAIEAGQGAGPLIDALAFGWILLGEGDIAGATQAFADVASDQAFANIAYTQLGYARAAVGDYAGANALLSGNEVGALSVTERSLRARAEILVQLGERDAALELLDFFTSTIPDPGLLSLRDEIAAMDASSEYRFIASAEAGIADVFFAIAQALGTDNGSRTLPLLYARAAHGIDPAHTDALIYSGQLLAEDGQYALAADAFAAVPGGDLLYVDAQLGLADALFDLGEEGEAVSTLQALVEARPGFATVHASLGDLLRRADRCGRAITAYSNALDLVDATQERYWFIYYTRGICHTDQGNYDAAEADFRQALVLNPEQPQVLNNLGYALVEQRRDLDEALDMIERAVAGRPDSGYIVDSLGWVLYRLERYEEAVEPMERAVALLPHDPIINDHLGDVYWMVGRYREAEFQWLRALSFDPLPEDAERIRLKLDIGLYEVLEAEGGVGETQ